MSQTVAGIEIQKADEATLKELDVFSWPIWTKETSTFPWQYDEKETCYLLEGSVTVKTDDGEVSFGKGDMVTFAKGLSCTWDIKEPVKKHYQFG